MVEPGKYSSEQKDTEDFKKYSADIKKFKANLVETWKVNSYFIVQSRKGPRLLDFLFDENERHSLKMNVLTEHALPFLFDKISKEPDKEYNLYVIDDAIYFGTTIENLYAEIKDYIKLFDIKIRDFNVYAIIKSRDAKELHDINIIADNDVRKGYNHYFVNLLMSDVMSMGNTMEVEFPIVSYNLDKPIKERELYSQFSNIYNGKAKIYVVPEYTSNTLLNDGVFRFSILFDESDALFSKIRFYVKGNVIRMAFMMPYNLTDNSVVLDRVFDSCDNDLRIVWESITNIINDNSLKVPYQGSIIRSRKRTLVILANYLISLKLFFREYDKINKVIGHYTGSNEFNPILDETGLTYLLCDDRLVNAFMEIFKNYLTKPSLYLAGLDYLKSNPSSSQVFETPGYPGDEDRRRLQDFNSRMVYNSKNIGEALSALLFNQTVLVEQWYRSFNQTSNYRLKFGYNFHGLIKTLQVNGESNRFASHNDEEISMIHAWIDNRVDRGCIVPQYIIDPDKNHWDRVFRPGENEEALLSSLTRFVTFVLQSLKRIYNEKFVLETILKKVLSVVYVNVKSNLSDVLRIELSPSVEGLYFYNILDKGMVRKKRDVVEYLKDMFVLSIENNSVEISKRFYNTEQTSSTTFSTDIDKEILKVLNDLHYVSLDGRLSLYQSYRICNEKLLTLFLKQEEGFALKNSCIQTIGAITGLRDQKPKNLVFAQLKKAYEYVGNYILPEDFDGMECDDYISKYQSLFVQVDFYINIILFAYFAPTPKMLLSYLETHNTKGKTVSSDENEELIDSILKEYRGNKDFGQPYSLSDNDLNSILESLQLIRDVV